MLMLALALLLNAGRAAELVAKPMHKMSLIATAIAHINSLSRCTARPYLINGSN
jgi:hypothetical protein